MRIVAVVRYCPNVISHIKSAHPIEMWRSNKLGIKEKISRGNFPRLIFSCPVPSGLPHRSHCVPMNMNRCIAEAFLLLTLISILTENWLFDQFQRSTEFAENAVARSSQYME